MAKFKNLVSPFFTKVAARYPKNSDFPSLAVAPIAFVLNFNNSYSAPCDEAIAAIPVQWSSMSLVKIFAFNSAILGRLK